MRLLETHTPTFWLPPTPDPEQARRERVAIAVLDVSRFDGPFADHRVRLALRAARGYATGPTPAAELAAALADLERCAADAERRAVDAGWTWAAARRASAAAHDARAARAVAAALARAVDPTGCLTPFAIDPTWRTTAVVGLALGIADGRPELFPVLADALEDAGCADAAVLDHARGPGPHAADCRLVRAILTPHTESRSR